MAVGATNFPTSLDTVVELVEVTNDASTQLNGALTINATTITVDSTSLFPSSGIITIDSENISYTGKTATTFTGCTRAAESTTAATHDDNATVELLITAALPTVHAAAIIAIETKLGSGASIDAAKIADGSISNTEFQYLNGVSSAIQTQLDSKQATFGSQTANTVYAGPTSGGAASPSFRALVSGDLPTHNQAWSTITSTPTTLSGYGITDAAANGAVTASGLTMATARLLGRSTASTGAIEEISIGSGLTLSAGTLSASGGGGSPGGSGSEIQFRSGASTFGAVTGSSVSGANVALAPDATTGNGFAVAGSAITSGNLVSIAATGTAAASNSKHALLVSTSGANATSGQTTYGAEITNTSTGTSSTNIALNLSASGGTNNYALNVSGGQILANGATYSASAPAIAATNSQTGTGIGWSGNGLYFINSGTASMSLGTSQLALRRAYAILWSSNDNADSGSFDTGLARASAGVIRTTNGSTGAGGILIAPSTASITGSFTVLPDNAATNSIVDIARLGVNSTGTAAAGFGGRLSLSLESSTTADTLAGTHDWYWSDATHASRTSYQSFSVVGNAVTHEILRLQAGASGTPATALQITSNAAGSGVTLSPLSSGSNEGIAYNVKGAATHTFVWDTASSNNNWQITSIGNLAGNSNSGGLKFQLVVASSVPSLRLASDTPIIWNSTSTLSSGTSDTTMQRSAAGVVRVAGASSFVASGAGTFSSVALTPSQITANQDNYTPGVGLFQRWSSDASRNVTGLAAGQAGQIAYIWNVGSFDIVLVHESASSTAANRFTNSGGADITLAANRCAFAQYDATSSRWRAVLL